jgi:multiple sugar transport system permease protein
MSSVVGSANRRAQAERRLSGIQRPNRQPSRWASALISHGLLLVAVILTAAPFVYVFFASLKDGGTLFTYPPKWLPIPLYFGNFEHVLFDTPYLRWMLNTMVVAGTVTCVMVIIDSMAGYAYAKMDFTGKRFLFLLMITLLLVPSGVILIPLYFVCSSLHILDTYLALILPALANPLGVFLMRQYILALPDDLENAARLDGLGEFAIYRTIVLPLVKPGLVVLAVITFSDVYASFIWPLVAVSNNDLEVMTVGLASFRGYNSVNYGLWSAGAVLSMIPIGTVFFLLQRQFMSRSLAGALKQ